MRQVESVTAGLREVSKHLQVYPVCCLDVSLFSTLGRSQRGDILAVEGLQQHQFPGSEYTTFSFCMCIS